MTGTPTRAAVALGGFSFAVLSGFSPPLGVGVAFGLTPSILRANSVSPCLRGGLWFLVGSATLW
jgi:hypothetical protein